MELIESVNKILATNFNYMIDRSANPAQAIAQIINILYPVLTSLETLIVSTKSSCQTAQENHKRALAEAKTWQSRKKMQEKYGDKAILINIQFQIDSSMRNAAEYGIQLDNEAKKLDILEPLAFKLTNKLSEFISRKKVLDECCVQYPERFTAKTSSSIESRLRRIKGEIEEVNKVLVKQQADINRLIERNTSVLRELEELLEEGKPQAEPEAMTRYSLLLKKMEKLEKEEQKNCLVCFNLEEAPIALEQNFDIDEELEQMRKQLSQPQPSQDSSFSANLGDEEPKGQNKS